MNPGALAEAALHGESTVRRRAIAKAITLLESTRADHRLQADELLTALLPHTGQSFRLGISGVPGVGKSTFIEALGLYLIALGHRVAVLTIDPSSTVSGAMGRRLNCRQRESTVAGTFCGSVVASTNLR